ncbi:TM2 domain-containing protein [Mycolicibacterium fortuitum]|uniref:TM2 domain-containing protein n=1 Tax=Mycolicibacterium fortuitum TaxID=1766 RepID=UPI001AEFB7A1|nr:TM2 domain-containing protein [Mycolicibacterium fortuitum]MBP3086977.1 TM2 domain-containing protein [Mycolicibacterium fortuitum]
MAEETKVACTHCRSRLTVDVTPKTTRFRCADCGERTPLAVGIALERNLAESEDPPKSAVAAGLLQLFFGFLGLGRFYLGYVYIGAAQLTLWIIGLMMLLFGLLLSVFSLIGFAILIVLGIWILIEAIMMIAGAIPDAYGRALA